MSETDNSTIAASRDNEGNEVMDRYVYGDAKGDEGGVVDGMSPYANASITSLLIGPTATRFAIHTTILAQSTVLAAKADALPYDHLALPDLDEPTAHTLIHFLYTHTYQPLPIYPSSTLQHYKLAATTYCAATLYDVSALSDLAKNKITSLSPDISIPDILVVARDHAFALLPENETWYSEYLEDTVRKAMKKDPEPFRRPEFIMSVGGNARLLQVVWKGVVGGIATPTAEMVKETETETDTRGSVEEGVVQSPGPEDKSQDAKAGKVPLESPSGAATPVAMDSHQEGFELDDIEPTVGASKVSDASAEERDDSEYLVETPQAHKSFTKNQNESEPKVKTPQAPEPFTDELGFETSKTYQQMGKKPEPVSASPRSDTEDQSHKRSDSFMQSVDATPVDEKDDETMDVASSAVNGSNENASVAKKSKKAKKKKNPTVF